ncbi:hypothetical protein ES702_04923 [subsurface metagenome]
MTKDEWSNDTIKARIMQLEETVKFWKKACLSNQHEIYVIKNKMKGS